MARLSFYQDRRDVILALLQEAASEHSRPPTVRDLASATGVGVATMHSYLTRLSEEGAITWSKGRHRSLQLTSTSAGQQDQ